MSLNPDLTNLQVVNLNKKFSIISVYNNSIEQQYKFICILYIILNSKYYFDYLQYLLFTVFNDCRRITLVSEPSSERAIIDKSECEVAVLMHAGVPSVQNPIISSPLQKKIF